MKHIMPSNPMYAPPSYAEMKIPKPAPRRQIDEHTKSQPLPIKFMACKKCRRPGGTLVKTDLGYIHTGCQTEGK